MVPVTDLRDWMLELPANADIDIDEDNLRLVAIADNTVIATYEIGGIPEELED